MLQRLYNVLSAILSLSFFWNDIWRWIRRALDFIGLLKAPDDIRDIFGVDGMTTVILVVIACIGLLGLYLNNREFWHGLMSRSDHRGEKVSYWLIGILVSIGVLLFCLAGWFNENRSNGVSIARTANAWSSEKVAVLEQIYRILQDNMLPAYDELGDKYASPWRRRILEVGPKEYAKEIHTGLQGTSAAVRTLSELLENQAIYPDLVDEFKGAPEQQNKMVAIGNAFQERLSHLPDKPEERNLNLVEAEAKTFTGAVGAFGQWVRGLIQRAVELKQSVTPQSAGTWRGNKFIYNEPRLIQTFTVEPEDDGKFFRFHVSGVDSGSFVMFKVEYDEGYARGLIVIHENEEVNWSSVTQKTQSGVQLRSDNTTVLKVQVPGPSDMTIIRVYAVWWRPKPDGTR